MTLRFDQTVLGHDHDRRSTVLGFLSAALDAVDPRAAVTRTLRRHGPRLTVGDDIIDLPHRVFLIAIGKAAPAMGRAARDALGDLESRLLVVSDHSEPLPEGASLIVAGHPVPNQESVRGATEAIRLAESAGPDDLVICLISGGGSALAEIPSADLSLDDVGATSRLMLGAGVPIEPLNVVRHHLSDFKGGRLAQATKPARLVTLVLSDIAGNPLPSIASGPTVADPSTFHDAIEVLSRFQLLERVPSAVRSHLQDGAAGMVAETLKDELPGHICIVVADVATATAAIRQAASDQGMDVTIATNDLRGEASSTALACVDRAGAGLTVYGGETTVTVEGDGIGGRNQEGALAVAAAIDGRPDIVFATLATDGVDGPTAAAGAIVDGGTARRGRARGLEIAGYLARNDSNPFLDTVGDLLMTGPTGTNVGDVWLVLRDG